MNGKTAEKVYLCMELMRRSITPCVAKVEVVPIDIEFLVEIAVKVLFIPH